MKILCFRNSKLGDYLISIGSLNLIKKKYPGCEITYLTDKNKNLKYLPKKIENDLIVKSVIYYDYSLKGLLNLIFKLRKIKFDKVINLQEEKFFLKKLRNYIFFSFCKIPKKISFFYKNQNYRQFSEAVQLVKRVDINFKASNIHDLNKPKIKNEKPILSGDYITISHGGFSSKLWDLKNWKILLRLFINNYNHKVIILGSKNEKKAANLLTQVNHKRIISMCGSNLKELFNNIKFSKLHITIDNGTMHVSTIYNKKVICLFDNTKDPYGKWFPENKNALILIPKNGICEITPYLVFNKIKNLI